jgi:hypothetical protein
MTNDNSENSTEEYKQEWLRLQRANSVLEGERNKLHQQVAELKNKLVENEKRFNEKIERLNKKNKELQHELHIKGAEEFGKIIFETNIPDRPNARIKKWYHIEKSDPEYDAKIRKLREDDNDSTSVFILPDHTMVWELMHGQDWNEWYEWREKVRELGYEVPDKTIAKWTNSSESTVRSALNKIDQKKHEK